MIFHFEIPDEAVELLKKIKAHGAAEFRDYEFKNLEEFKSNSTYMTPLSEGKFRDEGWFFKRNFCEPDKLEPLFKYDLIKDVEDAWHPTYEISERGEEILEQAKDKKLVLKSDGAQFKSFAYYGSKEEFEKLAVSYAKKLTNKQKEGRMLDVAMFILGTVNGVLRQEVIFTKLLNGESMEDAAIRIGIPIKVK